MRRGRVAAAVGVAVVVVAGTSSLGPGLASSSTGPGIPAVVIRDEAGEVLAEVPLPGDRFAVSYRNSIYKSLAESRYQALPSGRFRLVQIAADQRAVVEEYYAIAGPERAPAADRRRWVTAPSQPMSFSELNIAATDLGERTLHVPGHAPVRLWRLVEDKDPIVVLDLERTS